MQLITRGVIHLWQASNLCGVTAGVKPQNTAQLELLPFKKQVLHKVKARQPRCRPAFSRNFLLLICCHICRTARAVRHA
jgi:hypothetical protein